MWRLLPLAFLLALAPVAAAKSPEARCLGRFPAAPPGLPAPVVVRTAGCETVYVLRNGSRPVAALRTRLRYALCERAASLDWHGSWLLYSTTEGHAVAVDTLTGRRVDLTRTLLRLPGVDRDWAGKVDAWARWA